MSVDVKTPTKAQFEHSPAFYCGEKTTQGTQGNISATVGTASRSCSVSEETVRKGLSQRQEVTFPGRIQRKRRYSEKANSGGNNPHAAAKRRYSVSQGRNRSERIRLPTNFFLGGNITDPLNLNSLCNEEVSKALNAETPKSSPLPTPAHKKLEVQVIIPPNINDPLNLNSGEDIDINLISPKVGSKKYKKKHRKRPRSTCDGSEHPLTAEIEESSNVNKNKTDDVAISSNIGNKLQKVIDKIVSPALPQTPISRKRKRNSSEGKDNKPAHMSDTHKLFSPNRPKIKKQPSNQANKTNKPKGDSNAKFIYGNYNRYYGKRNPAMEEDHRVKCFRKDWFDGKDVLDIGCNIGHVTFIIAREFSPKRILGMDIDGQLISIARKNIRNYLKQSVENAKKYPVSMPIIYGPIAPPPIIDSKMECTFPNNISFVQGNYVLDKDEFVDLVKEEYDTILLLSISKWIHLNFGDDGLKRTFRRVFKHLRPGGRLVLEPQAWNSYNKKRNLTDRISKNYQSIKFLPEQFREYLLSHEVGFSSSEFLDTPFNKSKGFRRPMHVFYKPDTSYTTPKEVTESRGVTPLMTVNCTPGLTPLFDHPSYSNTPVDLYASRSNTPHFDIGSTERTPNWSQRNTPNYLNLPWSVNNTPGTDNGSPCLSQTPKERTPRAEKDPRQANRKSNVYTGIGLTDSQLESMECNSVEHDVTGPSNEQSSVSTGGCDSKCSLCSSSSTTSTDSGTETTTQGIFSEDHTSGRLSDQDEDSAKSSKDVGNDSSKAQITSKTDSLQIDTPQTSSSDSGDPNTAVDKPAVIEEDIISNKDEQDTPSAIRDDDSTCPKPMTLDETCRISEEESNAQKSI